MRWMRQFATPALGRDDLVDELVHLLRQRDHRLFTLTGEGGVGKTRVAVATASIIHADHPGWRVVAVDLADEHDPSAVPAAVAAALDLAAVHTMDELVGVLAGEPTLLVLDSFEHLRAATPVLARLLSDCPPLTVLVTSRVPLRLRSEHVLAVTSLAVASPDPASDTPGPSGAAGAAVELFRRTAAAVGMPIDEADLATVRAICAALGGLPLAIELAATRTRMLQPTALLTQLQSANSLHVLRGGATDMPARHRDLEATLAWSVGLLSPAERRVLDATSAVQSWSTMDELLAVCTTATGLTASATVDALTELEHHGLLEVRHDTTSFLRMRPLVREFVDGIADSDTVTAAEHALDTVLVDLAHHVSLMGRALAGLHRAHTIGRRHDDLLAAFHRSCNGDRPGDAPTLALALAHVWEDRPHPQRDECLRRAASIAAADPDQRVAHISLTAWQQLFRSRNADGAGERNDIEHVFDTLVHQALDAGNAFCTLLVCELSIQAARFTAHWSTAAAHGRVGVETAEAVGDTRAHASFLVWSSMVAQMTHEFPNAAQLAHAALQLGREIDEAWIEVYATLVLNQLPRTVVTQSAPPPLEHALTLARTADDSRLLLPPLLAVTLERLTSGDVSSAIESGVEGLRVATRIGVEGARGVSLLVLCALAMACDDPHTCVRIRGALGDRDAVRNLLPPAMRGVSDAVFAAAHERLGTALYDQLETEGAALRSDEVNALALRAAARWQRCGSELAPAAPLLTPKELEVLAWLARGRTNKEIALELGISGKTVMHHLARIFRKLDVRNRSEAVRWALQSGITESSPV